MAERQSYLRSLLIGERDMLSLEIAKVTYGDDSAVPVHLHPVPARAGSGVTLTEDFKLAKGEDAEASSYEFTTSKGWSEVADGYRCRPDGDALARRLSVAEQNTQMLSTCILSVNNETVVDPTSFARGLPMRDRQALLKEMVDRQPLDLTSSSRASAAGRNSSQPSAGPTSFVPSEQANYLTYEVIAMNYPGWALDEIRSMNGRQRRFWMAMIEWKRSGSGDE